MCSPFKTIFFCVKILGTYQLAYCMSSYENYYTSTNALYLCKGRAPRHIPLRSYATSGSGSFMQCDQ